MCKHGSGGAVVTTVSFLRWSLHLTAAPKGELPSRLQLQPRTPCRRRREGGLIGLHDRRLLAQITDEGGKRGKTRIRQCRPGAVESDNVTERTCVTRNRTRNNSATRVAGSTTLNNPLETRTKTRNSPTTVLLVLCERHAPCFGGVPSKQKREHMRSVGAPPANQQVAPVHNSGSSS